MGRVPSALARLSEHSIAQSLPASRSNTLQLYPEQVSVLPDGGHRFIGGDRASVRSLELTSPRHAPDNRSHHSLVMQTTTLQKPSVSTTDLLNTSLPPLRAHPSQLSLSRHNTLEPLTQPTPADYFMQRLPFKDDGRKHRFNLQTVMLIGCYTLLFVMAIVIGIVLSYQNGWLGFGSPKTFLVDGNSDNPTSKSVFGDAVDNNIANNRNNGDQQFERIQIPPHTDNTPVHNVVQVRDSNNPHITAGSHRDSQIPKSISGLSENVRNFPGNRPVQHATSTTGVRHLSPLGASHTIPHGSVPHPTQINSSPDFPMPSLIPSGHSIPQRPAGSLPGNAITTQTGRIIINAPPNPATNPLPRFTGNLHNVPPFGSQGNLNARTPSLVAATSNVNSPVRPNLTANLQSNITVHSHKPLPNSNNHPDLRLLRDHNLQTNINGLLSSGITRNKNHQQSTQLSPGLNNHQNTVANIENQVLRANAAAELASLKLALGKNANNNAEFNRIHMQKMKMLKEFLDSEGSGKLLQDLLILKNNPNSLNVISQHLSEVAENGADPSIQTSPPINIASIVTPAILTHRDKIGSSPTKFPSEKSPSSLITSSSDGRGNFRNSNVQQQQPPQLAVQVPTTQKPKSNIQVVRELLSSLINSPEVQQILAARNRERAQGQGSGNIGQNTEDGKVKVRGDEMRELLLNALAKEVPTGQSLQRLRLHGPQPSQPRQTGTRNRLPQRRGQKRGKITRAEQLVHFNTTSPSRSRGTLASRVLHSRMGETDSKKKSSIEHQSVQPPVRRPASRLLRNLSSARTKSVPHFTLRVKNNGKSNKTNKDEESTRKVIESVDMKKGGVGPNGEVVRHWQHMDNDGTVSQGTVRSDGSFAFTNCRPVEMCENRN